MCEEQACKLESKILAWQALPRDTDTDAVVAGRGRFYQPQNAGAW